MVFSSMIFVFLFLPVTVALYFLVPKRFRRTRNFVLLIASLFFYFYGEPKGIFIMLASIAGNYFFALIVDGKRITDGGRKAALAAAVIFNLCILGYYKYTGFILYNIERVTGAGFDIPQIVMPIGISFFTFQGMSYCFDVYRREAPAQRNILNVALYISMFPQLIAGPIVRYESVAAALVSREEGFGKFADGVPRFIFGLGKKMILANPMGALAGLMFGMGGAGISWAAAWIGAAAYSLQIYFDFSGYSDMAIGLGKMFGFEFLENFNYPYISRSITEFWRRWHMSLSFWFRDYVYIPLGGNRKGAGRQLLNIVIVWSLTGLWHGAAWNFVLWGVYFAVLLIAEKLFLNRVLDRLPNIVGHIYALFFIVIGWVIFNGGSLSSIISYLGAMFRVAPLLPAQQDQMMIIFRQYGVELLAGMIFSTPVCKLLEKRFGDNGVFAAVKFAITAAVFVLSVLLVEGTRFNPFIYFRF